ncbi:hypothetical protein C8R46DRAFT_885714 [Mycena filopes]|nr:hypothetical protein C8R46DRAFT_885714 [Mycena filopes]
MRPIQWGSPDAITDITTAAGWQILGCDSTALNQSIRLVCMDDPEDPSSNCGHLYQNTGAVNKLVRLPQNCGASAFARISDAWVPADQSIPASIQARIVRRDGTPPVVKALALDVNFAAVDYSKCGQVRAPRPHSHNHSHDALCVVVSGDTASGTVSAGNQSASAALEGNLVNVAGATGTLKLKPLALKKSVNLINTSVNCGPAAASLKVDMAANTNAQATISVTAKGTVVPPSIPTFQVVAGVTADIGGTVTVAAGLNGHLDSGVINLLTTGVPGLDFPGILTVGPIFKVDTQFVGDVQVPLAMTVGINFAVNNATLTFPPSASTSPSASAFSVGDMPLTLNAEANVKATGTMTATLTPSLNLGVTALGNTASAQIFLSFDTSAALTMTLNAGVIANATTDNTLVTRAAAASASFSGCVKVNTGIAVNVGASGTFFTVITKTTKAVLFSKNFTVFTKCFGVPAKPAAAAAKKTRFARSTPRVSRLDRVRRAALSCPIGTTKPTLSPITSGTVSKSRYGALLSIPSRTADLAPPFSIVSV